MTHATLLLLAFVSAIIGLAAYLQEPTVLLALAFAPLLSQDLPYGLAAAKIQGAALKPDSDDDEFGPDKPQPMGFLAELPTKESS